MNDPLLWLWVSFIVTFAFTRLSTRLIRAQVSWWPGNVSAGGRHLHHMVLGVILVCVSGTASFSLPMTGGGWRIGLAVVFGAGAALVLDEFALVLNLRDVYWTNEGRSSVDAVILAAAVTGLVVAGASPFGATGQSHDDPWPLALAVSLNLIFVAVALLKGKLWTGVIGILVPTVAFVGAARVARPASPWARWRYGPDSRRRAKSERREVGRTRNVGRKEWLQDLVAGRPDPSEPGPASDAAVPGRTKD